MDEYATDMYTGVRHVTIEEYTIQPNTVLDDRTKLLLLSYELDMFGLASVKLERAHGTRFMVFYECTPGMIGRVIANLEKQGLNIFQILRKGFGSCACMILDVDHILEQAYAENALDVLAQEIQGIILARVLF
jgi:hypothetical protein